MTGTDVREALHEIGHGVAAPPIDRLAFQAEVRRERRRRAAGRVVVAGAAAACLALAVSVAGDLFPERSARPASPVTSTPQTGEVGGVVYAVVDGRLVAWDGASATRLDPVEGLLGSTQEGVWAVDRDSRVVSTLVVDDPEGPLPAGFAEGESPVEGAVQSAALSDDGRYLAWVTLDEEVVVYDLAADEVAWKVDGSGGDSRYLVDVTADGVLISDWNELTVWRPDGSGTDVQPTGGTSGLESQLTPGRLLVSGSGGDSTLFALDGSGARELRSFEGVAAIAPDGERVVTFAEEGTGASMWDAAAGRRPFGGLDGVHISAARWVDDGSESGLVLVTGSRDQSSHLWSCDPVALECGTLPIGEGDVRITR
ncbi:MAG: WD40 repeat domain-containing protein [Nocardioides sp.]